MSSVHVARGARRVAAPGVLWLAALALPSCIVTVHVDSRPVSAEVQTPKGEVYRLPADIPIRWAPFDRPELLCTAVGYRDVTLPLRLGMGPFAFRKPRGVEISLVEDHGPSGTWTEDDAP